MKLQQLVDAGDTDFGKRPELMAKIEQQLHGLRMNVELGVSVGGLTTNADSECLTAAGEVIPGLYAVGNNAGGLFGIDYNEVTIPGISLGRCVTFGWLLGQHLAK
ncbi:MAG: FAD-binding protein [Adlercreutzia equolifaciens]